MMDAFELHVVGRAVSAPESLHLIAWVLEPRISQVSVPENVTTRSAGTFGRAGIADCLVGSLVIDGSKAERLLGWCPPTTLDEQLKKMMSRDADS